MPWGYAMQTFLFPATVVNDGEFKVVSFRDIPEAITQVSPDEDFLEVITDALATAMEFYIEDDRIIPFASEPQSGEICIDLPLSLVGKIILHNTMLKNGKRQADIARALNIPTSEMARIVNPSRKTKIDTLAKAVVASGGRMVLTCA